MDLFTQSIPQGLFFVFWFWFSNNDRPYSSSLAPITYPLSLSTPSRRHTLWRAHLCTLSSCAAPKIPILSLPNVAQILQIYFVHSLKHLPDIPSMDLSTPPHIREWDLLVTYRINFSYFYFPFSQYALWNLVPSRLFERCNLPDQPSLNHLSFGGRYSARGSFDLRSKHGIQLYEWT